VFASGAECCCDSVCKGQLCGLNWEVFSDHLWMPLLRWQLAVKVLEFGSFASHTQKFWWMVDLLPAGSREIVKFCYQELVKVAVLSIF
jgi:hypothetical protein